MADSISVSSSASQIQTNYEKYKDYFTEDNTSELGQMDFLQLMTEQMKNQDFMNPTDNSEYISQMAQFNTLQQMQQMNYYANANFAASLVGKVVTMASQDGSGEMEKVTDVVSSIRLNGTNFEIMVGGKSYSTANLMEVMSEKPEEVATDETQE